MRKLVALITFVLTVSVGSAVHAGTIRVAAAISLKEAMDELGTAFEKRGGDHVEFAYGASGALLAQIKAGAPIDAFISAGVPQMDELATANLIKPETRKTVAMNELVLIVPAAADANMLKEGFKSLGDGAVKRLAIGEPKSVPAGMYAEQLLTKLGLTSAVQEKLVYGTNVRQVLSYVERGEVSAGIVYSTDALQSGDKVKVIAMSDPSWHEQIEYPAAVLSKSDNADRAGKFVEFLQNDSGRDVLKRHGFVVGGPAGATSRP